MPPPQPPAPRHHHHHQAASSSSATIPFPPPPTPSLKPTKKRGSYNCGLCGLPKKGHICSPPIPQNAPHFPSPVADSPLHHHKQQQQKQLPVPRALSFDDELAGDDDDDELGVEGGGESEDGNEEDYGFGEGGECGVLPRKCVSEVMRRLPPGGLMAAGGVCRGWRECSRRIWKVAEELRLRVPARGGGQIGFVGSVLERCSGLVRLSLRIESHVYATMLACIAFSCPNLESVEISTSGSSVNRITGDELGRFVADRRCLSTLKMEGCSNLGALVLSSSSLSTLWLSDLHSLPKMVFNCPSLKEISLQFACQERDNTDLVAMADNLGRYCPRLQNVHIASSRLSHSAVLALTAAKLRGLRMLSLVMGTGITDASVAAISSSYSELELLDLSGSSISDSGIGMICNVFPHSLSKLLLALCPNVTSSGVQFATAQLPLLELMDCGMTICDHDSNDSSPDLPKSKLHLIYQKLIIKHNQLKKLSLWGCSGLDALSLSCPKLNDLNLNSCRNLNPERLFLDCPNLESVHASGCQVELIEAIKSQVDRDDIPAENHFISKRMGDCSKRVRIPHSISYEAQDDIKMRNARKRRCTMVVQ